MYNVGLIEEFAHITEDAIVTPQELQSLNVYVADLVAGTVGSIMVLASLAWAIKTATEMIVAGKGD